MELISKSVISASLALLIGASSAQAKELWPDISKPLQGAGGGENDAAVIVGVEKYVFLEQVPGARQNAQDWQAYLLGTLRVPSDKIALLRDEDATLEQMSKIVSQKAREVKSGGTLWFIFIGHGTPSQDGWDGLLVGVDALRKAESLYARSLSRLELLSRLAQGPQARTIVLLDACFSGRAPSGKALAKGLRAPIVTHVVPQGIDRRTILLIAAKSDEWAGALPRAEKQRPAFSYLALGALRGWAADAAGNVTAAGLVKYSRQALKLADDRIQTPRLFAADLETRLGRGWERPPDLAKIAHEGPKGGDFQVSNPPAVPKVEAPQPFPSVKGIYLGNVDELLKYQDAVKFDNGEASAERKAQTWRQVARDAPKFANLARRRAMEWERYVARREAVEGVKEERIAARDSDWVKLFRSLALDRGTELDRRRWVGQFIEAYMESPGLEPSMAKALIPYTAREDMLGVLTKSASKRDAARRRGEVRIEWVAIPGGTFMMGSEGGEPDEKPVHRVDIRPFRIAKTLVTVEQYKACVDAGACTAPSAGGSCNWDVLGRENHPVNCVSWKQAKEFASWAGGRLPSESEWEYAARGAGRDQKYPWGNEEATCEMAVISEGGAGCGKDSTWPVCSKFKGNTAQGLCDMAGNVWEWVQDGYHDSYRDAPADGRKWEDDGLSRVIRGGAWDGSAAKTRASYRSHGGQSYHYFNIGLRPAKS